MARHFDLVGKKRKVQIVPPKTKEETFDIPQNQSREATIRNHSQPIVTHRNLNKLISPLVFVLLSLSFVLFAQAMKLKLDFTGLPKIETPVSKETEEALKSAAKTETKTEATASNPAPAAALTPAPTLDKSALKITILNGSRITGLASAAGKTLEVAGFKIEKIGNTRTAYNTSFIYYNEGKLTAAGEVLKSLTDRIYTLEENKDQVGASDILVVIGKK